MRDGPLNRSFNRHTLDSVRDMHCLTDSLPWAVSCVFDPSLFRIYILAQLLAALLACSIFGFVSSWGPLSPLTSMKQLDLNYKEALVMWATGLPPARLQHSGKDTITDVLLDEHKADEEAPPKASKASLCMTQAATWPAMCEQSRVHNRCCVGGQSQPP